MVLDRFSLSVAAGECVALLGPSGSGKTTVLRLVNRLVLPTEGRIEVLGRDLSTWDSTVLRRSIGYVMQDGGLFPHLTATENVQLVPRLTRQPLPRPLAELFDMIGLPLGEYGDRYPHQLSGGQRQRVGVARALALDPPVLLLDEPFGALDPLVRWDMQRQFLAIRDRLQKTVLFVTHDLTEAARVGGRIVLLDGGQVVVDATPAEFAQSNQDLARGFREAFWPNGSWN